MFLLLFLFKIVFGLSDLLKDGYKHLSGVNEVTVQNIDAVTKLADITRTSLGPHGNFFSIAN